MDQWVTVAMHPFVRSEPSLVAVFVGFTRVSPGFFREKVEALFSGSEKTLVLEPCTG